MVERRKTEAIATKRQRVRGEISLSSKKEKNYESNTSNEMDLDQVGKEKYPLQL